MSRTDKDRPWWVQQKDPLNQRFRKMGSMGWSQDGTTEHFWKKMWPAHGCWCCSQKKAWASEQSAARVAWNSKRRKLIKGEESDE